MQSQQPLYNSRLTKSYLQYLALYHPEIQADSILKETGMTHYQIEDPAHWFTQEEVDRFHDVLVQKTGVPEISQRAGRFVASSQGMGAARQYILGLVTPTTLYQLMEKHYPLLSRAADISTRKIGATSVEITSIPRPGVVEKPYQCQNRLGIFEGLAELFTGSLARIEHPECLHRGEKHCRYIISWQESRPRLWRRLRNASLAAGLMASGVLFFLLPAATWALFSLGVAVLICLCAYQSERLEAQALFKTLTQQRKAAEDSLAESEIRYNNALMVQEIGHATSTILEIENLIAETMTIIEKRLDFDRGMIMLADRRRQEIRYVAGFGHTPAQEAILRQTTFSLTNPESQGIFILAMREKRPFLVNNIKEIEATLSQRSLEFARRMDSQALICVPIVFHHDPLGILVVDNSKSKRPLRQSDMSLLIGVASQLATSIINAGSFEQLQESEKNYRELVETASSLILRIDAAGRITFVNQFARKRLDLTDAELLGSEAAWLIMPPRMDGGPRFSKWIASIRKDPMRPEVKEIETRLPSGKTVWISWTFRPIHDEAGRFREVLCIGNDITELKLADQEMRDLQSKLLRAQKMEAIGTLAGGVAHDLNNILSGIVSYPELLLMDIDESSPLRKPILTIKKSGERAAAIVQDLLTLARRGVETTEVLNINQTVREYLASPEWLKLQQLHPEVTIETQLDEHLPNIVGSPLHLSKTVMNLVTNALEAMPDGGTLALRTERRHLETQKIGYDNIVKGDYAVLAVSDTGIGISPEDMDRIFEPFYTKKAMGRSGTGLGMAVVWGTVKDHRGHIEVNSRLGQGTDVNLYFRATDRPLVKPEEATAWQAIAGRGETVLVVDDVREQREIATQVLEKLGYAVTVAESGEAALDHLQRHSVDLVLLDMIMDPGIEGLETFKRIRALRPGQKAIIVSGYSESVQVREAMRLGAGAYLKKPYRIESLGRTVREELDR